MTIEVEKGTVHKLYFKNNKFCLDMLPERAVSGEQLKSEEQSQEVL